MPAAARALAGSGNVAPDIPQVGIRAPADLLCARAAMLRVRECETALGRSGPITESLRPDRARMAPCSPRLRPSLKAAHRAGPTASTTPLVAKGVKERVLPRTPKSFGSWSTLFLRAAYGPAFEARSALRGIPTG